MSCLLKRSHGVGIRASITPRLRLKNTGPIRHNSTTPKTSESKHKITWPEYLEVRRKKHTWETALTIPSSLLGLVGGAAYFGSLETDATKSIMGFEPMLVYGGCTLACLGLGYLLGPAIGSAVWRMTHRSTLGLIEAKDREFYKHIVKNRVDPTAQSANNPVPDFYGEKIGSLHQYRQWLRDQARFRRKAQFPEE